MAFLALLIPVNANAKDLSESDYWTKTKLPVSLVEKFITNEKCKSSPDYLNSCREALKAAQIAVGTTVNADSANEFEKSILLLEGALEGLMPVQMFRARVINAHLAYFDAHAKLEPSAWIERKYLGTNQNYVGIGVVLEATLDGIVIREIAPGSPAEKAGVMEDDLVHSISKRGVRTAFTAIGNNLDAADDLLLDKAGTEISIRVVRDGKTLDLIMKRAQVTVPHVTGEIRDGIGYIRINTFNDERVCKMVIKHLNSFVGMKSLILDLRGNPGGEKSMAVCVAELFLGPKPVVGTKSVANGIPALLDVMQVDGSLLNHTTINWEGGYIARPKYAGPLVVLVDGLSASGSEIVAGALQDHNRAWIIGERTFGKGSVQNEEFVPDHATLTLKYTTERFYQPLGRSNQAVGISPSFEVPRRSNRISLPPLREADQFRRSLAAENAFWTETRPEEVEAIRGCLNSGQRVDENLAKTDYQKAYALGVLSCM